MATTEGPGGPHRGRAGKLPNSTVNGSTSGKAGESQCWIRLDESIQGNMGTEEEAWTKGQTGLP